MTISPKPVPPSATVVPGAAPLRSLAFRALGTNCEVRHVAASPKLAIHFENEVRAWVERFEARYSRFRHDSIVSRINQAAGTWVDIDQETEQMLDVCAAVYGMSDGMLDVTSGPLMRLWNYRQPPTELPDNAQVAAARKLVGWPMVQRAPGRVLLPVPGMSLDFGGWGKEWAVDAVAQLAEQLGVTTALIDFGHDIRAVGTPPGRPAWHVGLENPSVPGTHSDSIALLAGKGIASSGDYIRNFTRGGRCYGHIVDLRTGWPVSHNCRQATVIASNCVMAGILSTTAFVLGPSTGLAHIQKFAGTEGLLVTDTSRAQTRGFWNYVIT